MEWPTPAAVVRLAGPPGSSGRGRSIGASGRCGVGGERVQRTSPRPPGGACRQVRWISSASRLIGSGCCCPCAMGSAQQPMRYLSGADVCLEPRDARVLPLTDYYLRPTGVRTFFIVFILLLVAACNHDKTIQGRSKHTVHLGRHIWPKIIYSFVTSI